MVSGWIVDSLEVALLGHVALYDLEERTFQFAKRVRIFVKTVPITVATEEDSRQLIKASGSVGANYREANDALGRKDFLMRIRISRKEAKESAYWLKLISETNTLENPAESTHLLREATELVKILSSIAQRSSAQPK